MIAYAEELLKATKKLPKLMSDKSVDSVNLNKSITFLNGCNEQVECEIKNTNHLYFHP